MAEQTYSIDQDLKEADAMAKALVPYVHQDTLYGNVGGGGMFSGGKMPSLTVGGLVMRLRRLTLLRDKMTTSQQTRLDAVISQNQQVLKEWHAHYEGKMVREAGSRLDAMNQFFEECSGNPRACAANYGPEASRRTIVQELLIALHDMGTEVSDDLQKKMRGADSRLRRTISPSDFIWAAELQEIYPQKDFWWLYSRPQA